MFEVDLVKLKKDLESKFPHCTVTSDGGVVTIKTEQTTKISEHALLNGYPVDRIIESHQAVVCNSFPNLIVR